MTVLDSSRNAGLLDGLQQTMTLAWRSLVHIRRSPSEILHLTVQPIMLMLLFVYVFGGALSGSTEEYLAFAIPGLILQNALFTATRMGFGLSFDIASGVFDRLRTLPIARTAPLAGRIVSDFVKHTWSSVLIVGVAVGLGFRMETTPLMVLVGFVLLLVFCSAISWPILLLAVLLRDPDKAMAAGYVVTFPLAFASNAFVPEESMPGWLRTWVDVNPVTSAAEALRGLLVDGPVLTPMLRALAWSAAVTVVFAPLAVYTFRRRQM
ncbi:ABC transporter permease [Micromonospora zamorensis]|uniref:ABC transporter permease n=1 Tax=Micromonospora zamorensis TaxID=709883 RepID=UPI003D97A024